MEILLNIWGFFVENILKQPAYFIGLMVFIGYVLLKKRWYETLSGCIKAVVGYFILIVGSSGLVNTCRPIIVALKDKFNLNAVVIDPYFSQIAVDSGLMPEFGRTFSQVMALLLIAFVFNIILVIFRKQTKVRSLFTTGHVQVQQAALAFWIVLFCFPKLGDTQILIIMGLLLGTYWAVGSNLTVKATQELTEGGGFCIAHQQMFAVPLTCWISKKVGKNSKKIEDLELPGWTSIFNENMVVTSLIMFIFFGGIISVLGKDFLVANDYLKEGSSFIFYIITTSLHFAVYLSILQLGVRLFVTELTQSFVGISTNLLPGVVPGIDVPAIFCFGSPNAITVGFISAAIGQFIAILVLLLLKNPILIVAGFVPMFFGDGTLGVYANNKGGLKAAIIVPMITGMIAVFGSAMFVGVIGLAKYGGYMGMFDWVTVWPMFTLIMKYGGIIGVGIIVVGLLIIPQIQYLLDKEGYFLITDDYEAYMTNKENSLEYEGEEKLC